MSKVQSHWPTGRATVAVALQSHQRCAVLPSCTPCLMCAARSPPSYLHPFLRLHAAEGVECRHETGSAIRVYSEPQTTCAPVSYNVSDVAQGRGP